VILNSNPYSILNILLLRHRWFIAGAWELYISLGSYFLLCHTGIRNFEMKWENINEIPQPPAMLLATQISHAECTKILGDLK